VKAVALLLVLSGCSNALGIDGFRYMPEDGGVVETPETRTSEASVDASTGEASTDASIIMAETEATVPPTCITDLSNVGTSDFHISFTVNTTASVAMALVNQRTGCNETSTFWDITMSSLGGITGTTDDGTAAGYAEIEAGNSINDGQPHSILIERVAGYLMYGSDGVVHPGSTSDTRSLGTMAPLVVGTDPCAGTVPTVGSFTNLCITVP
jgi:hypothetical protein